MRRLRTITAPAAFLTFVVLAVAITVPVWTDPGGRWIGYSGDPEKFINAIGWYANALAHGMNPLHHAALNAPEGVNMAWETLPLLHSVLTPVTLIVGPIASYNLALTSALALNGFASWLWLRRRFSPGAAFMGGLFVMLSPYVMIHAVEHLNLIMVFPLPMIFNEFERIVIDRDRTIRRALGLGAWSAVALLLSEELAAIAAVTVVIAWAVVLVVRPGTRHIPGRSLVIASVVAGVCCAPVLVYQFFGPQRITGTVQASTAASGADLLNLVVPTPLTGAAIFGYVDAFSRWTTNIVESTAYLGFPLLVLVGVVAKTTRRDDVRLAAVVAAIVAVLSLGNTLHVNGTDTHVPLPGWILGHLPVLDNMILARLSVATTLALAVVFAAAVENRRVTDLRAALIAVVIAGSLLPRVPFNATADVAPGYFRNGDAALTAGTMVVLPFADVASTSAADLWQADAHFTFVMPEGYVITAGPDGHGQSGPNAGPMRSLFDSIRDGNAPLITDATKAAILRDMHAHGVHLVVLGPADHHDDYAAAMTAVLGVAPRARDGVDIWSVPGD